MRNPHKPVTLEDTRTSIFVNIEACDKHDLIEITGISRGVMTGRPADSKHPEACGLLLVADHAPPVGGGLVRCWRWRAIPAQAAADTDLEATPSVLYLGADGKTRKTKPTAKTTVACRVVGIEYGDGAVVLAPSDSFK